MCSDSVQNDKNMAWYNSTTRHCAVHFQPAPARAANTVEVVDNIKKLLPQFRSAIPGISQPGGAH